MEANPDSATDERRGFRPHLVAVLFLLAVLAVVIYGSNARSGSGLNVLIVGSCVVALLSYCAGWLGFRLAGRSQLVGNLVFLVAPICLGMLAKNSPFKGLSEKSKNQAAAARLEAANAEIVAELSQETKAGRMASGAGIMLRQVANLREAAEQSSGHQRDMYAAAADVMQSTQDKMALFESVRHDLAAALDARSLTAKAQISERLKQLDLYRQANAELRDATLSMSDRLDRAMADRAVPKAERERFVGEFTAKMQYSSHKKISDENERVCDIAVKMLRLFEREWGHWQYDAEENVVNFSESSAHGEFVELHGQLSAAAARRQQDQEPGLGDLEQGSAPP